MLSRQAANGFRRSATADLGQKVGRDSIGIEAAGVGKEASSQSHGWGPWARPQLLGQLEKASLSLILEGTGVCSAVGRSQALVQIGTIAWLKCIAQGT